MHLYCYEEVWVSGGEGDKNTGRRLELGTFLSQSQEPRELWISGQARRRMLCVNAEVILFIFPAQSNELGRTVQHMESSRRSPTLRKQR